jgi:hypothetical protein
VLLGGDLGGQIVSGHRLIMTIQDAKMLSDSFVEELGEVASIQIVETAGPSVSLRSASG